MAFKKGNVLLDGFLVLVVLTVLGIIIFNLNYAGDLINDDIQADPTIHNESKVYIGNTMGSYATFWDNAFIFIFILFWIFVVISSYRVDTHPLFMVVSIILMIIVLGIAVMIGNSFEEHVNEAHLAPYIDDYPKMYFINTHMLETLIVIMASIILALFAKSQTS